MERRSDGVRVSPSLSWRAWSAALTATVWSLIGIVGLERLGADTPSASLLAWWSGIAVAAVGLAGALWRRVGLFLTADALVIRRVFGSRRVLWAEVMGVTVEYVSTGRQSGMQLALFVSGRFDAEWLPGPLWSRELPQRLTSFLGAGFDVPVNPRPPWKDRADCWRGELLDDDPLESIRSIRRAAVGPLNFEVQPVGKQFRVVVCRPSESEVVDTSDHYDTVDAAVADAVSRISRELGAHGRINQQGRERNEP